MAVLQGAALVSFAVALAVTISAPVAQAHTFLVRSSPEAGARLRTSPDEVVLDFTEIIASGSTIDVHRNDADDAIGSPRSAAMRSCCSNPAGTTLPLASCGTIGPVVGVAPVRPTSAEHSRWRVAWTWCVRLKVEIAWIRGNLHFDSRAHAGAYLFDFIEVVDNPPAPPDPPRAPHPS